MLDPVTAEGAGHVVEERLEQGASERTEQPCAEMFAGWTVEAVPGTPLAQFELTIARTSPNILTQMVFNRDLGFLSW